VGYIEAGKITCSWLYVSRSSAAVDMVKIQSQKTNTLRFATRLGRDWQTHSLQYMSAPNCFAPRAQLHYYIA